MANVAFAGHTPLGRELAIQLVAGSLLPVSIGGPRPSAMILEQEGKFRIRALVVDGDAAHAAAGATSRARSVSWMPEHYYSLGQPSGEVFAEAESREALIEIMRTMAWQADW